MLMSEILERVVYPDSADLVWDGLSYADAEAFLKFHVEKSSGKLHDAAVETLDELRKRWRIRQTAKLEETHEAPQRIAV